MAAAATQLVFEPRLEGVIAALLSRQNPVEIVSTPLKTLTKIDQLSWRELQMLLAKETGEIALGVRTVTNGDPVVTLNPSHQSNVLRNDEVVMLSKCDRAQY